MWRRRGLTVIKSVMYRYLIRMPIIVDMLMNVKPLVCGAFGKLLAGPTTFALACGGISRPGAIGLWGPLLPPSL